MADIYDPLRAQGRLRPRVCARHAAGGLAWLGGLLTHRVSQQHISEAITCSGTVTELFEAGGERRARLSIQTRNADGQLELAGDAVIALT